MKYFYLKKPHLSLIIIFILLLALIGLVIKNEIKKIISHPVSNVSVKKVVEPKATKKVNNYDQDAQAIAKANKKKNQNGSKDFFVEYRLERDRNSDRQMEVLQEIVNNTNSVDEARQEAQKRILKKTNIMDQELELENLIKARGYKDAIVMRQEKSITILVQINNLTAEDMAKITEIAEQSSNIDRANIVVLAKT